MGQHCRIVDIRKSIAQHLEAGDPDAPLLPHLTIIYLDFPNSVLVWQGDISRLGRRGQALPDPLTPSA